MAVHIYSRKERRASISITKTLMVFAVVGVFYVLPIWVWQNRDQFQQTTTPYTQAALQAKNQTGRVAGISTLDPSTTIVQIPGTNVNIAMNNQMKLVAFGGIGITTIGLVLIMWVLLIHNISDNRRNNLEFEANFSHRTEKV